MNKADIIDEFNTRLASESQDELLAWLASLSQEEREKIYQYTLELAWLAEGTIEAYRAQRRVLPHTIVGPRETKGNE